jgi:phage gpG-like protein
MVVQHLNQRALYELLESPNGGVGRELYRRGVVVQSRARQLCPVDTGRLRASITVEMTRNRSRLACRVGTNVKYARFVHDGTGIYGPHSRPITPTHGQVLVFIPRGSNAQVFASSVRGAPAVPFLAEALKFGTAA